jgi:hypothetical protein
MLNFKEFLINEADSPKTAAQKLKTQISEKFDAISEAKKSKKPGDVNSEIESINKQSALYAEISTLMKSLAAEIKKTSAETKTSPETIY